MNDQPALFDQPQEPTTPTPDPEPDDVIDFDLLTGRTPKRLVVV